MMDLRKIHEEGDYSKLPFCAACDQWAGFNIVDERIVDDVFIRSSDFVTYYNKIDRMNNWKDGTKRIDFGIDQ